jgi:aminoglycoside phosphotransferase (APT) family kinase protein
MDQQLQATRESEIWGIDVLAERVPSAETAAIVHGDYRLDNCLARAGDIKTVLDWEMFTIGDPMADLATARCVEHGETTASTWTSG